MFEVESANISELQKRIDDDLMSLKINIHEKDLKDLKIKQADPQNYKDFEKTKDLNIAVKQKENIVMPWLELKKEAEDLFVLAELGAEASDTSLTQEINESYERLRADTKKLELRRLFTEETDINNCYLSIHSGAGGTESCDWAGMLLRMYTRWVEARGFDYTVINYLSGEEAGVKAVTLHIQGSYAHGFLKSENGVHRLVRISPFDSNKKRHTSFCSVFSTAEITDTIDVEIDNSDLRIDTFRASGAGGQHVNTTDSAIRITHRPSGIVVSCQAERSQHQNKERAMKILRSKLYEKIKAEREVQANANAAEKKKIEWGSQIRSYVFHPYNMVKDHRTNYETGNTQAVMDGAIEDFIYAWLKL